MNYRLEGTVGRLPVEVQCEVGGRSIRILLAREPAPNAVAVQVFEERSHRGDFGPRAEGRFVVDGQPVASCRMTGTRLLVDPASEGLSGFCVLDDGRQIPVVQWPGI